LGKRLVPLLLVALLVLVHAQLWFGRGSLGKVAGLQRELEAQKAANAQAQQANERLASEVRDLKEGQEMIEERARAELGMVKPNEIYVQIARPVPASAPKP
jgi:cell division protein FtsB